jgi:glutamyl/glutaminyl-tRNA synthetase
MLQQSCCGRYDAPTPASHLPLIHGLDKGRLSKRHGATSIQAYRELGYLPAAMNNYLARLGWSAGDQEIFTLEELIEKFALEHVGKSPAIFNPETLLWVNAHHVRETPVGELAERVVPILERMKAPATDRPAGATKPGSCARSRRIGSAAAPSWSWPRCSTRSSPRTSTTSRLRRSCSPRASWARWPRWPPGSAG